MRTKDVPESFIAPMPKCKDNLHKHFCVTLEIGRLTQNQVLHIGPEHLRNRNFAVYLDDVRQLFWR